MRKIKCFGKKEKAIESGIIIKEKIIKFNEAKEMLDGSNDDLYFEKLKDVLDYLSSSYIFVPCAVEFLSNDLKCKFRKDRLPEDFDLINNPQVKIELIKAELKVNSNTLITLPCFSEEFESEKASFDIYCALSVSELLKTIVEDGAIDAIVIDPETNMFIVNYEMCEYIKSGCDERVFEKFKKDLVKQANSLEDQYYDNFKA